MSHTSDKKPTRLAKNDAAERGDKPSPKKRDVLLIHGQSEDGRSLDVIRHRDNRLEVGTLSTLKEGQAIHGEVVKLRPHKEMPLLCDVEVQVEGKENHLEQEASVEARSADQQAAAAVPAHHAKAIRALMDSTRRSGPAQVATPAYRQNWDALFGRSRKKPSASTLN